MNNLKNYGVIIRLYPTDEQAKQIVQTAGCSRFVYNQLLNQYNKEYSLFIEQIKLLKHIEKLNDSVGLGQVMRLYGKKYNLSYPKIKEYSSLKNEFEFLKTVDSLSLANSKQHLDKAISNSIKSIGKVSKAKYHRPKFKKRTNKFSYQTNNVQVKKNGQVERNSIEIINVDKIEYLKLPKLKKVKIGNHRELIGDIKTVTITLDETGKFYATLQMDLGESYVEEPILVRDEKSFVLGIDVGITDTIITSDGDKINFTPGTRDRLKSLEKKRSKYQRQMSRRLNGGANYNKSRIKKTKVDKKIARIVKDENHKVANQVLSLSNHFNIEDLRVKKMKEGKRKAKSLQTFSLSQLLQFIEYKAESQGKTVMRINSHYPSTQLCSCCGYKNTQLKGNCNIREWECSECQAQHDRDINAAINIKNYQFT